MICMENVHCSKVLFGYGDEESHMEKNEKSSMECTILDHDPVLM